MPWNINWVRENWDNEGEKGQWKSWDSQWIKDGTGAEEPMGQENQKKRNQKAGYSKLKLLKVISYQPSLGYIQEISVKDIVENKTIRREARELELIIYLDNKVTKTSKRSSARESAKWARSYLQGKGSEPVFNCNEKEQGWHISSLQEITTWQLVKNQQEWGKIRILVHC